MSTPTARTLTRWDRFVDPYGPRYWPDIDRMILLVGASGPVTNDAIRTLDIAVDRGAVVILPETVDALRATVTRELEYVSGVVPALRVERMADLHDGDGLRALCQVQAKHRALVLAPREPIPTDREHEVAATVVQWLGSPVGQGFLRDLGYEKTPQTVAGAQLDKARRQGPQR